MPRRSRGFLALSLGMTVACGRPPQVTNVDIARVALKQLFVSRERAQAITLWQDTSVSLTLGALSVADAGPRIALDSSSLALALPTRVVTRATMDTFFRSHPAGWDAWFAANPSNAGLVEVAASIVHDNDASVVVGRACGEHCRNAWRLTLKRVRHEWLVKNIEVLAVPKS